MDDRDELSVSPTAEGHARAPGGLAEDEGFAHGDNTVLVDLASFGPGDPAPITAATLERSTFPRLVRALDEVPFAGAAPPASSACPGAARDLRRTWRVAVREGDLATCRAVFSTFVDTADTDTVVTLARELRKLADRTEQCLRARFSDCIREKDYRGALRAGEQMSALLPDRPLAREFARIKPHLLRRAANANDPEEDPRAFAQGT